MLASASSVAVSVFSQFGNCRGSSSGSSKKTGWFDGPAWSRGWKFIAVGHKDLGAVYCGRLERRRSSPERVTGLVFGETGEGNLYEAPRSSAAGKFQFPKRAC